MLICFSYLIFFYLIFALLTIMYCELISLVLLKIIRVFKQQNIFHKIILIKFCYCGDKKITQSYFSHVFVIFD